MNIAPAGGIRIAGRDFTEGSRIPQKYRRQAEQSSRARDPAQGMPDAPQNFGRFPVPQVLTFSGMMTNLARSYRYSDEAMRHSVENAHAMLNDPVVSGPIQARQMMVALLNWSIESEDDKNPELKAVANDLTKICARTWRFTEYRRNLLEAIWYGRTAIQNSIGFHTSSNGVRRRVVSQWMPISGDKLLFRYDDGSGEYDPTQVGIRFTGALGKRDYIGGDRKLEPTNEGLGYFLEPWERRLVTIHKHMIRDGEFEDPISGGQIHGVGIRHFIYWVWFQKQETMAQIAELIDRTGMGFTIYYYPTGNDSAKKEMEAAGSAQSHTNVILVPRDPNDQYDPIQQIPPNTIGLQTLHDVVENFFNDMIIRAILGQTLSTKASGTGMNSGVSELQKDTLFQVARYDAVNLEETLTREFVHMLRDFNFPKYRNVDFWFRISTKVADPQGELDAIFKLWQMGAQIKTSDIFDRLDLALPDRRDHRLFNPQIVGQIQQMLAQEQGAPATGTPQQPGMPDGSPAMTTPGSPIGTPSANLGPHDGGGAVPAASPPQDNNLSGQQDQLSKASDAETKKKLFGPILYRKHDNYGAAIEHAVQSTNDNPSDAQREAGNYEKGKFYWHGIEISIETPKGVSRRPEWPPMAAHYGYVRRFISDSDGDNVDVFIGPHPESELVFCVDQVGSNGKFDEHKFVIGAINKKQARELYASSFTPGWNVGKIRAITLPQFRWWLDNGDTGTPIAKQKLKYSKQRYGCSCQQQYSSFEERKDSDVPEKYQGSDPDPWVQYVGPHGGRGWQNSMTMEVRYQTDKPSADDAAEQKDSEPSKPSDKEASADEPLNKGDASLPPEKPQATPFTPPHADPDIVAKLEALPNGSQWFGYTKEHPGRIGMTIWTKGTEAITTEQFAAMHASQLTPQAFADKFPPPPMTEEAKRQTRRNADRSSWDTARKFKLHEEQFLRDVCNRFGLSPKDQFDNYRMGQFAIAAATLCGFNPHLAGLNDKTDESLSAAKFLETRETELHTIITMARFYGWTGGSEPNLAKRGRKAGWYLKREAIKRGWKETGQTESDQFANSIQFLADWEQQQQQHGVDIPTGISDLLGSIAKSFDRPIGPKEIAIVAVGFFLGYMLMKRMKRGANGGKRYRSMNKRPYRFKP